MSMRLCYCCESCSFSSSLEDSKSILSILNPPMVKLYWGRRVFSCSLYPMFIIVDFPF